MTSMSSWSTRLLVAAVCLLSLAAIPYALFLLLYGYLKPSGSPVEKHPFEPTVSIVLPTYNEERIIQNKLEDIVALDYPLEKMEVVVVDSSTDRTPDRVRSFFEDRESPSLTLVREEERRGLAVALNEAYAAASNEVVVKTDCDSRIATDALREAVANLSDPSVAAVTGRNVEVLGGSEVEAGYRDVQAYVQTLESHIDSTLIFHGPFSAFRREEIVPIDEDSIADDTELALKIRRNGKRVIFDPDVWYQEAAHSEFSKRRAQKDRRAMGLLRLLFRNRDALGRHGLYGGVILPFNCWFMIVSPWLVVGGLCLGLLAGLVFFLPLGVLLLGGLAAVVVLGSRDALGPGQTLYALFDTQVSLVVAAVKLARGEGSAIWDIDEELRNQYE